MLFLQRGDVPERRTPRASGAGTGTAGTQTGRRRPAGRGDSDPGLRKSLSDAVEALAAAVRKGDAGAVEALLDADPALVSARRPDGSSFVLFAVYCGHPRLVEIFRARGRSLDLFEATAAGDAAGVRAFLASDPAAARAVSPDGFPVLGLAVFFGHAALADLLLAAGADPGAAATNAMKVTPLHSGTSRGDAAMVKKLLDKGADPDARQQAGWTSLHNAAAQGSVEIVRLLRAKGADISARTDDGKTAADLAGERGHAVLAESLRER
ncbi:MAG: ankyrin repeat domain-containing protein [Thermoanaerobaculia bacterium]